jgi:hypothetical protein
VLATVVDTQALLKTVVVAAVAGVGVTLIFSLAILGLARFGEMARDGRNAAAAAFGALAVAALAVTALTITIGIIVMAKK